MTVLLDTGLVFAFLYDKDAQHKEATALVDRIARLEFGAPFVTDHVMDELFVLVRSRTKSERLERSAKGFLPLPDPGLKGLTAISLGGAVLQPAWDVFDRYRDQKISFTDATLIVTMRELRVDVLATLDERLRNLVPTAT